MGWGEIDENKTCSPAASPKTTLEGFRGGFYLFSKYLDKTAPSENSSFLEETIFSKA
jgi:hypothetical protein